MPLPDVPQDIRKNEDDDIPIATTSFSPATTTGFSPITITSFPTQIGTITIMSNGTLFATDFGVCNLTLLKRQSLLFPVCLSVNVVHTYDIYYTDFIKRYYPTIVPASHS
jgi:hypothetical protein